MKVASSALGKFLVGEDGKTLYIFKKDSPGVERVQRRLRLELAAVPRDGQRHAQGATMA